jgi:hypothetical protein
MMAMSLRLFAYSSPSNALLEKAITPRERYLAKGFGVGYNLFAKGKPLVRLVSGRGSVRLERCVRVAEAPGSNPGAPTG